MRAKYVKYLIIDMAFLAVSATAVGLLANNIVERDETIKQLEQDLLAAQDDLCRYENPVAYNVAPAPIYDIPLTDELQQYTYDVCSAFGIQEHYDTVLGIMWQESYFKTNLISDTDDWGAMQVNSCNFDGLEKQFGFVDFLDPYQNIYCGISIFSTLVDKYEDVNLALMAYNLGEAGAADLWGRGIYNTSYSDGVRDKAEQLVNGTYRTN